MLSIWPPHCILAVSDEGVPETELVSTDPKPTEEGDAICVLCVQIGENLNYWVKTTTKLKSSGDKQDRPPDVPEGSETSLSPQLEVFFLHCPHM